MSLPDIVKCHLPWENLLISANGRVKFCCFMLSDIGSIVDAELPEIWNGPMALAMRRKLLHGEIPDECRLCPLINNHNMALQASGENEPGDEKVSPEGGEQTPAGLSPVPWARNEIMSRIIASSLRPRQPSVLVLSLPRSGSSWAGETLGNASDAMYLREPITQGDQLFYRTGTVFSLDDPEVEKTYRFLASRAFLGNPHFSAEIVQSPAQWNLAGRCGRRIVIKEVNPLACQWYIDHFQPRIIFLVRHPAAVALSMQKLGWLGWESTDWQSCGDYQGSALRHTLDTLDNYPDHTIIQYETLCTDPVKHFRNLFLFAELKWSRGIQKHIETKTKSRDDSDTGRNSLKMRDNWHVRVNKTNTAMLRKAYEKYDLPWYGEDSEW